MVRKFAVVTWCVAMMCVLGSVSANFIASHKVSRQMDVRQLAVLVKEDVRPFQSHKHEPCLDRTLKDFDFVSYLFAA